MLKYGCLNTDATPIQSMHNGAEVKTLDISECADFLKIDRTTALRLG